MDLTHGADLSDEIDGTYENDVMEFQKRNDQWH